MVIHWGQRSALLGSTFPSIAPRMPELVRIPSVQIPSVCWFMIIRLERDICDTDSCELYHAPETDQEQTGSMGPTQRWQLQKSLILRQWFCVGRCMFYINSQDKKENSTNFLFVYHGVLGDYFNEMYLSKVFLLWMIWLVFKCLLSPPICHG